MANIWVIFGFTVYFGMLIGIAVVGARGMRTWRTTRSAGGG